jgi:hypothetical protein
VTTFEAGIEGVDTALALDGSTLYIGTIMSPRANSVGVIAAFDVNCKRRCRAKWTGINFTDGAVSPPVVANGLVFAGKGPAEQVDSGVFVYKAGGCGRITCQALKIVLAGPTQFYLGAPLAVGNGRIAFVSNDNSDGHSNVVVLGIP